MWVIWKISATWLLMATFANGCHIDPKDAVFSAAKIGRATHYFFRNCSQEVRKLKPNPSPDLTNKFLRSICEYLDLCREQLPNAPFNDTIPCIRESAWNEWGTLEDVSMENKKLVEKILLCASAVFPSTTVAKHVIAYFLKISG